MRIPLLTAMFMLAIGLGHRTRGDEPAAGATATEGERWVKLGREALTSRLEPVPWYDSAKDGLRPMELPKREEKKKEIDSASDGAWLKSLLQILAYGLLGALLLLVAALLARAFLNREAAPALASQAPQRSAAADRVDSLPLAVELPEKDLLAAAERYYQQGDYSQAIAYLYSHELVELDRRQRIRLAKGKTNRQYLRELAGESALRSLLNETIELFERAFFGGESLDRAGFERCWRRLPQLNQLLNAGGAQ